MMLLGRSLGVLLHCRSVAGSVAMPRCAAGRRGAAAVGAAASALSASSSAAVDPALLAEAWAPALAAVAAVGETPTGSAAPSATAALAAAVARTIPLLAADAASVPFVCRYRADVVHPLAPAQVHHLRELLERHAALAGLRARLLGAALRENRADGVGPPPLDAGLLRTVQTTTSRAVLEDLYAPYKPPAKGSLLEQIQKNHPELVRRVADAWNGASGDGRDLALAYPPDLEDQVVHLLAVKIAAVSVLADRLLEQLERYGRIQTKGVPAPGTAATDAASTGQGKSRNRTLAIGDSMYLDFSCGMGSIRSHQVLAIERGVSEKTLQLSFDVDASHMEACLRQHLLRQLPHLPRRVPAPLLAAAVHQAWTRTLRRRLTQRLWSQRLAAARDRALEVFRSNLRRALLAPPLRPPRPLLAVDPGFAAGIKCAVLDAHGTVRRLATVHFLGGDRRRDDAVRQLEGLVELVASEPRPGRTDEVLVALGNGHGSHEARTLLRDIDPRLRIRIELVNEAGASVWSVTRSAGAEFPDAPPAAVAAISIGRRLQDPLAELVKVPPRSLGVGMYQHDLSEKELDEKLHLTSVDAVATVGVDCNSCSLEILEKVPGLSKLAPKVIERRPLQQRADLLEVPGLGPKTFQNCAAFCRVEGPEPLDNTLVHPESYDLARHLLQQFRWTMSEPPVDLPPRQEWAATYRAELEAAADKYSVSVDRVYCVLENLIDSMTKVDPRLQELGASTSQEIAHAGFIDGCSPLSPEMAAADDVVLQKACPVRNIIGNIRNIVDFGVFVDFGGHSDGLIHTSKLGPICKENLLVGQAIGIDVLSVSSTGKVELAVAGMNLQPRTLPGSKVAPESAKGGQPTKRLSSVARDHRGTRGTSPKRPASNATTTTKRQKTHH